VSLNRQKGFTLPELMMGVAILGGLSLVTMKLVSEQESNRTYMSGRSEISKAKSLLSLSLSDPENCRSILAGKKYPSENPAPAALEYLTSLTIPIKARPGEYKEILKSSTNYGSFRTREIYIDRPTGLAPDVIQLVVRFLIKSRKIELWGSSNPNEIDPDDRVIEEKLMINITKNASNIITDCGSVVSATNIATKQQFCESLGNAASWNAATGKCTFNNMTCPYGQVIVKVSDLGNIICKDINQQIDLNDLVDTTSCTVGTTKQFSIVSTSSGKLKVDCTGSGPVYLDCTAPWGDTVLHGASVTAIQLPTCVTAMSQSCTNEIRTCNNGTLSGSFTSKTCPVPACP
jgi:prepilin-type N-terminal cleavage/methylation domain-containing protein